MVIYVYGLVVYLTTLSVARSIRTYMPWNVWKIVNWNGCGRKRSWFNLRHYPGILTGSTRKIHAKLQSV
jgi:hypothetical protein